MRLHELKGADGAHRPRKRVGRGNAAGQGTTAGKGTKGEKARAGGLKAGFRGMSSRNFRLAKRRGFTNRFKVEYQPVNLSKLTDAEAGSTVDVAWLKSQGFVRGKEPRVKILADGELTVALHFVGVKASAAARQKIESAGGSLTETPGSERAPTVAPDAVPATAEPESTSAAAATTGQSVGVQVPTAAGDVPAESTDAAAGVSLPKTSEIASAPAPTPEAKPRRTRRKPAAEAAAPEAAGPAADETPTAESPAAIGEVPDETVSEQQPEEAEQ
jgi:large subunit ribosomal protein L15